MTRHFRSLAFAVVFAWAWKASAQGTLETDNPFRLDQPVVFTAHLTGNPPYTGDGMFYLNGNLLTYNVTTAYGFFDAGIHGPAMPGTDGPLIFMLHRTACNAPIGSEPGFCLFSERPPGTGGFSLSNEQISDLVGGFWYVQSGTIRGQILQVPEPSVATLAIFICASCLILRLWRRNHCRL